MGFGLFVPNHKIEFMSTKDLIVHLLLQEHPITAKKVYNRLRIGAGKNITFQGVYKALMELVEEGVVVKNPENEYELSIEWVFALKKFVEKAEKEYSENTQTTLPGFIKLSSLTS